MMTANRIFCNYKSELARRRHLLHKMQTRSLWINHRKKKGRGRATRNNNENKSDVDEKQEITLEI